MAYEDRAFPIGEKQTISQPYTVAYQTQLLKLKPFMKVLEIGTGSGYQAAVLAELGVQLFTIERQKKLYEANKKFDYLKKYPNIKMFYGDGYEGLPTYGPFDRVLITAAAPEIPTVDEAGLFFEVNLTDYLDTGLFLDHRQTRSLIGELAARTVHVGLLGVVGDSGSGKSSVRWSERA